MPWHFWDEANGTWLSVEHYPRLWTDGRGGVGRPGDRASGGLVQPVPGDTGWSPDHAHQPELSTVPYLLTGERWILDNLQAQAAAVIMGTWPQNRQNGEGLVVQGGQTRGSAWNLRTVDNAAWLSPDGTPEQAYFQTVSARNWSWLVAKIPEWTAQQGAAHGWLPGAFRDAGALPPWQQDFFATTAAAAARRGNADAKTFLAWQANFLVGRFTHAEEGFNPAWGTAYFIPISDPTTRTPYGSWAEMGRQMVAWGLAAKITPWESVNYNQLALSSLALVAEVTGSATAERVFHALRAAGVRGSTAADYRRDPTNNILPRPLPRPRCPQAGR
ncbi:MAG: hypothetical protein NZM07_02510 [Elioraea sp.]|nr:hypothetical protein [Elioraea sp.]